MSDSPIKKCLFPAAGYGTRFLPTTKSMPKEMMPIVNKPLIQYGVEEAMAAGMDNMGIITGRGKRALLIISILITNWNIRLPVPTRNGCWNRFVMSLKNVLFPIPVRLK